jgi:hypothetical protein
MSVVLAGLMVANVPAFAHNEAVHSHMVDLSYEIMHAIEINSPTVMPFLTQPPVGANPADWAAFLQLMAKAPKRYRAQQTNVPASNDATCGLFTGPPGPNWAQVAMGDLKFPVSPQYNAVDPVGANLCGAWDGFTPGGIFDMVNNSRAGVDFTGTALGFWAANVDAAYDDIHLWFRPQNAGGVSTVKKFVNDAGNLGIAILLAPFICLGELIAGNPSACWADAKDAGSVLNPFDEIDGSLPGFGDVTGGTFTGMWHHIQMLGNPSNEYDDHQGLLFSESGPFATLDVVDLGILVGLDVSGMSVNYGKSNGPKNYESKGGDGMAPTVHRAKYEWQFEAIPHTAFEPVDNLGQWGYENFRDPNGKHLTEHLGFALHAIGDATVPQHVAGTPAWGHRPFEDAMDRIWSQLRLEKDANGVAIPASAQGAMVREIVVQAFNYHMTIVNWRNNQNPAIPNGIPIRQIVTTVALDTANTSMAAQGPKAWPYSATASMGYFFGDKENTILHYANFPNGVSLYHPILVDGLGATLAVLTHASEVL